MKYCDITHTKFLKLYLVVLLILNSKQFELKNKKTLQIIVIKEDEDDI